MQRTIKTSINCTGIGVHTGQKVSMCLKPADENTGILFRRSDINNGNVEILAHWKNVIDSRLCTVIGTKTGIKIATIEHLMAALYGCEIDNIIIEIDGPEVPIMDGSSGPFTFLIECAGIQEQNQIRRYIRIKKEISLEKNNSTVILKPARHFYVHYELHYEQAPITKQSLGIPIYPEFFKNYIARARSFGFLKDVDPLRKMGFAMGSSYDNALVLDDNKILNKDGVRYPDELVRHKILDCVGDLYLAGAPILGHFSGYKSGHTLNYETLKTLFNDNSLWEYEDQRAH